jgi:hypothetical protein
MFMEIAKTAGNLKIDTIISFLSAIAAIASAIYATKRVRYARKLIEHNSLYELTSLSNQHNWTLFEHRKDLPAILPSWQNLTDRQWTWRVLIFNHLNLLRLAYHDLKRGYIGKDEYENWILMARFWFNNIRTESQDSSLKEGYNMLRQIMRPEEGYSDDFRCWLVSNDIISTNIVSTRDS